MYAIERYINVSDVGQFNYHSPFSVFHCSDVCYDLSGIRKFLGALSINTHTHTSLLRPVGHCPEGSMS
jgi:hypothetical protein